MGPGPVFDAELLTQARRRRMYVTRLVYGLLLFWILLESYINFIPSAWTGRAASLTQIQVFAGNTFLNFEILQAVAVLAMTPVLVAGTIAGERQRKTLHYLIASRLTSAEIVVGKLLARLLALGVVLAVGLPVLSLLTLLGGVDPRLVALGLAADVSMAVFLGGLAILVSSYVARAADAIVRTYALGLAWLFLPPIITFILSRYWWYEWIRPAYIWIDASNPILLLYDFTRGPALWLERLAWMIGIQLAAGTAFILVAVWRLRPAFRRGEGRRAVTSVLGRHGWRWRLLARPAMDDDPVRWKEFHTSRTGGAAKLMAVVLGLAIAGLVGYATWYLAVPAFRELRQYGYGVGDTSYGARWSFGTFTGVMGAFFVTTLLLGIATSAAGRVSGEREEDTWTSLVATPLDGREILLPKLLGAIRSVRWGFLMPLALWLLGLAAGSVHPLAVPVLAIELAVYAWFVAALGIYFSLVLRSTSRAQAATVAVLLVTNIGVQLLLSMWRFQSYPMFAGCMPMIVGASAFNYPNARLGLELLRDNPGACLLVGGPERWGTARAIQAFVLSLVLHGAAAFLLTRAALRRFDRVVDRPRRPALSVPAPKPEPLPVGP